MFKVKAYHVNPINVLCVVLLVTIIGLLSFKSAPTPVKGSDEVFGQYDPSEILREYQMEIVNTVYQKKFQPVVMVYDRARLVAILPMDNHCNLTTAIEIDND